MVIALTQVDKPNGHHSYRTPDALSRFSRCFFRIFLLAEVLPLFMLITK